MNYRPAKCPKARILSATEIDKASIAEADIEIVLSGRFDNVVIEQIQKTSDTTRIKLKTYARGTE